METRVSKTFLLTVLFSVVSLMSSAQTVSADTLPQQDSITAKVNSTPQTDFRKTKGHAYSGVLHTFVGASFFTIATIEKKFVYSRTNLKLNILLRFWRLLRRNGSQQEVW